MILLACRSEILDVPPDYGSSFQHLDPFIIAGRAFFHLDLLAHPLAHFRIECRSWSRADLDDFHNRKADPVLKRANNIPFGSPENDISKAHFQVRAQGVLPEAALVSKSS